MQRFFLFLFVFGNFLNSFSQYSEIHQLENAYQSQNQDSLRLFFLNWEQEYQPISMDEWMLLSDTVKDIYEIYYEFYNPNDYNKILKHTFYRCPNYDFNEYFVLPTEIVYGFVKSFEKKYLASYIFKQRNDNLKGYSLKKKDINTSFYLGNSLIKLDFKDTVFNFRPIISEKNCKILYFSSKYKNITDIFFNNDTTGFRDEFRSRYQMSRDEKFKRKNWMSSIIDISVTHDFSNMIFLTFPKILIIYFNEKRDQAYIYYYLSYQYREAIYEKVNNTWTYKSSRTVGVY